MAYTLICKNIEEGYTLGAEMYTLLSYSAIIEDVSAAPAYTLLPEIAESRDTSAPEAREGRRSDTRRACRDAGLRGITPQGK